MPFKELVTRKECPYKKRLLTLFPLRYVEEYQVQGMVICPPYGI